MNFADIENVWRSPHNRPSAAELEQQKMNLTTDLRRRHRSFVIFIAVVTGALVLLTGRMLLFALWPDPASDRFDFAQEWSFLLLLALPWAAALLFIRQYRRHRARHADYERSIAESVRALLDENRLSSARLKVVAILHGALLIMLPLVVYQLRAVGKAGDEILVPAFVVWPAVALGIGGGLLYHYRRKLVPERRRLEGLLAAYE